MREQSEDCFLLEGAVDAALDGLLEHHGRPVGSKVIGKLLNLLPVQVGPSVRLLVDVDADWFGGRNRWEVASKRPSIRGGGCLLCVLPVSTWGVAEWGMVAASWGMELMSGSGVLLGGEMASGVITIRGLSCGNIGVFFQQNTLRGRGVIPLDTPIPLIRFR